MYEMSNMASFKLTKTQRRSSTPLRDPEIPGKVTVVDALQPLNANAASSVRIRNADSPRPAVMPSGVR
jgi:hypothetical protein